MIKIFALNLANIITNILLIAFMGILWYYIRLTHRLRKETSLNNKMLAEQIRLLNVQNNQEQKEIRSSFIKPVLTFTGGRWNRNRTEIIVENSGGTARDIVFKGPEDITVNFSANNEFMRGEKARLIITGVKLRDQIKIDLECLDQLNDIVYNSFVVDFDQREIITEDNLNSAVIHPNQTSLNLGWR